jgi:hypothetical protein
VHGGKLKATREFFKARNSIDFILARFENCGSIAALPPMRQSSFSVVSIRIRVRRECRSHAVV